MTTQEIFPLLLSFMDTLLSAGCSAAFIVEHGYHYAVQIQREEAKRRLPAGADTDYTLTEWMGKAAIWVRQASDKLCIDTGPQHPIQYQPSTRKEL